MSVKWYSGHKGEERPISFTINDEEYFVKRVISEELVEDSLTKNRNRIFTVETSKGIYRLVYNGNEWTIKKV